MCTNHIEQTDNQLHSMVEQVGAGETGVYTGLRPVATVVHSRSELECGINSMETISTYRSDVCKHKASEGVESHASLSFPRELDMSSPGCPVGTKLLGTNSGSTNCKTHVQHVREITPLGNNGTFSANSGLQQRMKNKEVIVGNNNLQSVRNVDDLTNSLTKLTVRVNKDRTSGETHFELHGNSARVSNKAVGCLQRDASTSHKPSHTHIFRTNKSVTRRGNQGCDASVSTTNVNDGAGPVISSLASSGFFWHRPFANRNGGCMYFRGLPVVETINPYAQKSWHLEAISALTREQYASLKMIMLRLSRSKTNLNPSVMLMLSRNNWEILQEGTFGTVYVGCVEGMGSCAVKVPVSDMVQQDPVGVMRRYINEWDILSRCDHPNIVRMRGGLIFGVFDIWLCTELIRGADLHSIKYGQNTKRVITPKASLKMCRQLADAIRYLHTQTSERDKIVHRDIKPENIIVMPDWDIKLCDFGDACESSSEQVENISGATWLYAPPELLKHKSIMLDILGLESQAHVGLPKLSEKWDIWSMGCVFQEMFGYTGPFHHLVDVTDKPAQICEKMVASAVNGLVPCIPRVLAVTKMGNLIRQCLNNDANKRPTAAQICAMLQAPDAVLLH